MKSAHTFDQEWRTLSDEILTGMKEWRLQHPKATFKEIEAALDERLARLRARMLHACVRRWPAQPATGRRAKRPVARSAASR